MGSPSHPPIALRRGSARLVVPLVVAFLLIACGFWLSYRTPEQHTAAHVARTIRELAREGAARTDPGAGSLGPWRIAADGIDESTMDMLDFRLESGQVIVAARRARVRVDAATDTFTLELEGVTYARMPEAGAVDEAFVHALDRYTLGPVAWKVDIVADGGAEPSGKIPPSVDAEGLVRALEAMRPGSD